MHHNGSIIVFLVLVFTALLLILHTTMRHACLIKNLARTQEQIEYQKYMAEGLLNYGIAWIMLPEHWALVQEYREYHITVPSWPPDLAHYHGIIEYHFSDQAISMQVYLLKNNSHVEVVSHTIRTTKN